MRSSLDREIIPDAMVLASSVFNISMNQTHLPIFFNSCLQNNPVPARMPPSVSNSSVEDLNRREDDGQRNRDDFRKQQQVPFISLVLVKGRFRVRLQELM